ncbi:MULTISPECIES: hypothetical protein [Vibrio]|uniref:Outer membrane protein beta-barrel domain-containing protein n=1 Tax=Vibrio casei TaxID=673372 RepID=A0A368LMD9_9VIBR|nr:MULTISPECIES: hypothetical protein [Vibrio]RCS72971.1 hypothetical protein CIK83_04730 [Vibrio casei]SJN32745.1 hypothetical protein FM109_11365 [Vibrio casei]HBV75360.1 hypothetical protein [Vibrio sp.]
MKVRLSTIIVACCFVNTAFADEGTKNNTTPVSYTNHSPFKFGVGIDQGFSIVGQLYDKVNIAVGDDGISADYIFLTGKFNQNLPFTWYASVGGWYEWDKTWHGGNCNYYNNQGFCVDNNHDDHFRDYGVRVPFGLDWNFASRWDAYIQLSPSISFPDDFDVDFQAATGVRYAF